MNIRSHLLLLTCTLIIFSSCNRHEKEIYKIVPDNVTVIGSFSPGKIMEKGNMSELEFVKKALTGNEFNRILFENPGVSGIDMNSRSCVFLLGKDQKYLGVVMPLKSKKVFEVFLDKLGEEYHAPFEKETLDNFSFSSRDNNAIGWNNKLLIHLTQLNAQDDFPIEGKLTELFSLQPENCILSEKDFKNFLDEQKDINVWFSSNQIGKLADADLGMLNMLGAINNNYAHIFLEFQDGAIVFHSNLVFNADFKKSFDKFNIIDKDAEPELLKMLPEEDLILAGNFRLNPEKIDEIINTFFSGNNPHQGDPQEGAGNTVIELLKSLEGSMAFSINGIRSIDPGTDSIAEKKLFNFKIPVLVAAMKLSDEKLFSDFIDKVSQKATIQKKEGYYIINAEGVPFYIGITKNIILLSNQETYFSEAFSSGSLKNNLGDSDVSKSLVNYPICIFMNLDRDSYSEKVREYMDSEMDKKFARGMEGFGASLKSLTISGGIEKSEMRIEFKDHSANSLGILLKAIDKKINF